MRKIKKRDLYSKISLGSSVGVLLSAGGIVVSTKLVGMDSIPAIVSLICMISSTISTYVATCKSSKLFIEENIDELPEEQTRILLEEMEYHLKKAKKTLSNEKKYFTDAQAKIINFALDDDVYGLKDYVDSDEFTSDLKEDYDLKVPEEIEIPEGSNIIRFENIRKLSKKR